MPRRPGKKVYRWKDVIESRVESNPFLPDSMRKMIGVLKKKEEATAKQIGREVGLKEITVRNALPLIMRHDLAKREEKVLNKIRELKEKFGQNIERDMLYAELPDMSKNAVNNALFKLQIILNKELIEKKERGRYRKPGEAGTSHEKLTIPPKKMERIVEMGKERHEALEFGSPERAWDRRKFMTMKKEGSPELALGMKALSEKADKKTGISIFGGLVFRNIKIDRETFANPIMELNRSESLAKGRDVGEKFRIKDEEYIIVKAKKRKIAIPEKWV